MSIHSVLHYTLITIITTCYHHHYHHYSYVLTPRGRHFAYTRPAL